METLIFFFSAEGSRACLMNETAPEVKNEYRESCDPSGNTFSVLTNESKKQIEAKLKKIGFAQTSQNETFKEFESKDKDKGIFYIFRPTSRPIYEVAREINSVWSNVYFGARPYLNAMFSLISITDKYGYDEATEIIQYFLANATSFRGAEARRIKAELMNLVASHPEK